jgi:hypothetical protein
MFIATPDKITLCLCFYLTNFSGTLIACSSYYCFTINLSITSLASVYYRKKGTCLQAIAILLQALNPAEDVNAPLPVVPGHLTAMQASSGVTG